MTYVNLSLVYFFNNRLSKCILAHASLEECELLVEMEGTTEKCRPPPVYYCLGYNR